MSAFVSVALIDQDRAEYRRWWFSATLAIGLHGAVAMAALAWHITSKPLAPYASPAVGPFLVDLVLPAAVRSSEQMLPQVGLSRDRGEAPLERAEHSPAEGSAINRDSSAEPTGPQRSEAAAGANGLASNIIAGAPAAPAPPDNAATDAGGGVAASHASAPSHMQGSSVNTSRVDPGPIDTSITVLPNSYQHKALGALGQNRMLLLRPLRQPGQAQPALNNAHAPTNAPGGFGVHASPSRGPGAHIQDRVNAAIERQNLTRIERARNGNSVPGTNSLGMKTGISSVHDNSKNAIGAATGNNGKAGAEPGVVNGTTRNAVGMTIEVHPAAHGTNIEEHREGIAGLKGREGITGLKAAIPPGNTGLMAATSPPGILNGRGVARPGTGLTILGGAPKTVPGALSGSDFRPKHQ